MTAESILQQTAKLLEMTVDFTDPQDTENRLLSCLGYLLSELSEQYVSLFEEERMQASGGKITYRSLGKKAIKIVAVKRNGKKVGFACFPDHIRVKEDGAYDVLYVYGLSEPRLTDTIKLPPSYTEETISLGVAAEYLHRTGKEQGAEFFAHRYLTAIKNAASVKKNIVMPPRRFL